MRPPWIYVPTLYFAEGLPYTIVMTVSAIMYKQMGMSNQFIGYTSIFYVPWVIKMFWSPVVDLYGTKRSWITGTQLCLAVLFAFLAFSIMSSWYALLTVVVFWILAFVSATHDVAIDGYYLLALDKKSQAFFLGVRSTCFRLSIIFGSGMLVIWAGTIEKVTGIIPLSWSSVMVIPAFIFLCMFLFHTFYLPHPPSDARPTGYHHIADFREAFRTYFRQEKIIPVIAFILLYRLGEAMLVKMIPPFLLDPVAAGGLGLGTDTLGYVYGTVGVFSLCAGGIIGGFLISRFGLKRCIWPMALALNAPDIFYIYLSMAQPSLATVYLLIALEQLGYGLGFTAFGVFLMYITREPYKTSHFAISTGLMALGMMLPGMLSGELQAVLGYTGFFMTVLVLTLPGMLLLFFIPLEHNHRVDIRSQE